MLCLLLILIEERSQSTLLAQSHCPWFRPRVPGALGCQVHLIEHSFVACWLQRQRDALMLCKTVTKTHMQNSERYL